MVLLPSAAAPTAVLLSPLLPRQKSESRIVRSISIVQERTIANSRVAVTSSIVIQRAVTDSRVCSPVVLNELYSPLAVLKSPSVLLNSANAPVAVFPRHSCCLKGGRSNGCVEHAGGVE